MHKDPQRLTLFSNPVTFSVDTPMILTFDPFEEREYYEKFCEVLTQAFPDEGLDLSREEDYHKACLDYFRPLVAVGFPLPKKSIEDLIEDQFKLLDTGACILLEEDHSPVLCIRDSFSGEKDLAPVELLKAYRLLNLPFPSSLFSVLTSEALSKEKEPLRGELLVHLGKTVKELELFIKELRFSYPSNSIILPAISTVQ